MEWDVVTSEVTKESLDVATYHNAINSNRHAWHVIYGSRITNLTVSLHRDLEQSLNCNQKRRLLVPQHK